MFANGRAFCASERDPEVAEILSEIARRLKAMDALRGPERDDALRAVEEYAAQYALVLFYEVARLDSLATGTSK